MAKKVAIIGAGVSGLTAIKCCMDENLDPVCFERTGDIGGLWNFTEAVRDGQACVARSTIIDTSKEMMCFSDYPIPKEYPSFLHNKLIMKYFRQYADHFGLIKHIRFHTGIKCVTQSQDYAENGKWDITVKDKKEDKEETLTFDAVMICTGHHADCNRPTFPGLEDFGGTVLHTHDYKDSRGFEDKRVVVIGIGNSGADATTELSHVASQVYLSTRRGAWIFHRVDEDGWPWDLNTTKRCMTYIPLAINNALTRYKLNKKFNHRTYSLEPDHKPSAQHPTMQDDLPNRILSGSVIVKGDVKRFTKTGVEFEDGTIEDNIDAVILATGYIFGFPFVDKSVIDVKQNQVDLFKYAFPPDLKKQTLVVIGCFQPLGAIMPASELQCRLATRVFKGDLSLPTRKEMWDDIHLKQRLMAQRYVKSTRHTIQVDWVPFMDELAKLNGCKPNIWELFKTDPKLAFECFFGPCTPYQYRLQGPGSWKGAREAIMTVWDRVRYPLKTRPLKTKTNQLPAYIKLLAVVILSILVYYIFFK